MVWRWEVGVSQWQLHTMDPIPLSWPQTFVSIDGQAADCPSTIICGEYSTGSTICTYAYIESNYALDAISFS